MKKLMIVIVTLMIAQISSAELFLLDSAETIAYHEGMGDTVTTSNYLIEVKCKDGSKMTYSLDDFGVVTKAEMSFACDCCSDKWIKEFADNKGFKILTDELFVTKDRLYSCFSKDGISYLSCIRKPKNLRRRLKKGDGLNPI